MELSKDQPVASDKPKSKDGKGFAINWKKSHIGPGHGTVITYISHKDKVELEEYAEKKAAAKEKKRNGQS